jgi:two-component system, OmpR family, phosphate regulon response regulator PhoB
MMKKTILVVDDEEIFRRLLRKALETSGYRVLEAVDGVEALMVAQEHAPDLILMDIFIPVMDGYEACRMLKNGPDTKSIPIIAMSGRIQEIDRRKLKRSGVGQYFVKPISMSDLRGLVNECFK